MPGTIILKPIEANLTHNTDLITRMNPYCTLLVGHDTVKGQVCKKGGKHPHWSDAITIPVTNQSTALLRVLDQDKVTHDDVIGHCTINLKEVEAQGHVSKWLPLSYKMKPAGEILVDIAFEPNTGFGGQMGSFQREEQTGGMTQTGLYQQEEITNMTQTTGFQEGQFRNEAAFQPGGQMFVEQRQVVEPHTFMKEVDVVETRPVLKQIEVMEPHKVIKEVAVTEAVPVRKQIEVVQPEVVMKEVEVIEPRLVTKEIQVVENVPVMKTVEVIEPRTFIQEVETLEPRTFTKQVEVTEHHPVIKQVTVTEPVTLKKAVEFVEPIIHTQTITKEIQQPVIVDERVETHIGPATMIDIETETTQQTFVGSSRLQGSNQLLEQERLYGANQLSGQERLYEGGQLSEQERLHQGHLSSQRGQYSSNFQSGTEQMRLEETGLKKPSTHFKPPFKP